MILRLVSVHNIELYLHAVAYAGFLQGRCRDAQPALKKSLSEVGNSETLLSFLKKKKLRKFPRHGVARGILVHDHKKRGEPKGGGGVFEPPAYMPACM